MTTGLTRADVLALVTTKLGEVLDRDPAGIAEDARFEDDLHADSLDLLEVVEGVEADLRARGFAARLSEDDMASLRTVRDAADRLHHACGGSGA